MLPTVNYSNYIGNNDYRGFLNYQAQNGNGTAGKLLNNVGNDGGWGNTDNVLLNDNAVNQLKSYNSQLYANWNAAHQAAANSAGGDPNTAAYYNDQSSQLQNTLGGLDAQQAVGLGNLQSSYNNQANRLDQQNAAAKRDYETNAQQNQQGYSNNRNAVVNNTRATANALQRLLGLAGSGNSSAAYEQAPYAAGLQGSIDLRNAQQNYSNNQNSLDTNWQDTQRAYSNAFDDLNSQKYQQENGLRSSIAQTRAGLLNQIGQAQVNAGLANGQNYQQAVAARAPYQSQIDDLMSQITNLGNQYANPVLRTPDIKYASPSLNPFLTSKQAQISPLVSAGGGDISPTFLGLLANKRDNFGNALQV